MYTILNNINNNEKRIMKLKDLVMQTTYGEIEQAAANMR